MGLPFWETAAGEITPAASGVPSVLNAEPAAGSRDIIAIPEGGAVGEILAGSTAISGHIEFVFEEAFIALALAVEVADIAEVVRLAGAAISGAAIDGAAAVVEALSAVGAGGGLEDARHFIGGEKLLALHIAFVHLRLGWVDGTNFGGVLTDVFAGALVVILCGVIGRGVIGRGVIRRSTSIICRGVLSAVNTTPRCAIAEVAELIARAIAVGQTADGAGQLLGIAKLAGLAGMTANEVAFR